MNFRVILELPREAVEELQGEPAGQGGFQSLFRKLKSQASAAELTLYPDDLERLARYSMQYGEGGFQNRLRMLLGEVARLLSAFQTGASEP